MISSFLTRVMVHPLTDFYQVLAMGWHGSLNFLGFRKTRSWRRHNQRADQEVYEWHLMTESTFKTPGCKRHSKTHRFGMLMAVPENHEPWRIPIIDPGSDIFLQWNRVFLFSCLVGLFVDPLFFYVPSVISDASSSCMTADLPLAIIATFFRSIADIFYILRVIIKFRTAYVSPNSRIFGRGELVMDPKKIVMRYLKSDFALDLIAALPLLQILMWLVMPAVRSCNADHTNNALLLVVLVQYVPKLYVIFPLSSEIIEATGVVTKTAWAGAAYNLLLYMLASHVLGASWYLLSMDRHLTCWRSVCNHELSPVSRCRPQKTTLFNYGMFANAVTQNVVSSTFLEKYFYCLWWGLQSLSSYGQTLATSTFIGETVFAILIVILGLVLFAQLIGNMQTYLQSITVRFEEWRLKRRDTEEWMRHRQLPHNLQERVRRFVQYKWLATRGVDEETVICALPKNIRRDIQRHLCLDLVRRVPFFSQMDNQLQDAICERIVSSLSTKGTYIVREGDPVEEMLFFIRGNLESSTTNGGRSGFFNTITLRPGDFCGEELLSWALLPKLTLNLPSSTRTVRALEEVEAFALRAEDLKFVANQFRRLHSKKLQHTLRFYSHHWRTWATCFIQAAWRRHTRRSVAKSLSMSDSFTLLLGEQESNLGESVEEQNRTSSQPNHNLDGLKLPSRFSANNTTRRGAPKEKNVVDMPKLQKPTEQDFSADD